VWKALPATLIFYEGPSRLGGCLADMAEMLGNRGAAIGRELTKRHEEIRRGTLATLADHYREAPPPRGEIVIVVGPPEHDEKLAIDLDAQLDEKLARLSLRDAVAELAAETGVARRAIYERALARQRAAGPS
jgi:16S rRNA (cytidine1402-2'-O)-methyltransferase